MNDLVKAGDYVALRLPSDLLKVVQIQPYTPISLGKVGTIQANHLLGRPYHLTYEILDKPLKEHGSNLRVVSASELHEIALGETALSENLEAAVDGVDIEVVGEDGKVVMRTNQHIVDDGVSQRLSADEIEALKRDDVSGGKDIIAKILESHSTLDKKTSFSLAKYTLRKTRKYIKRFTVSPIELPLLINWLIEDKDAPRIMEMRLETLSLLTSWANVHWSDGPKDDQIVNQLEHDHNRWLVVDEASGLLVAALAERMGILYPNKLNEKSDIGQNGKSVTNGTTNGIVDHDDAKDIESDEQKRAARLSHEMRIQRQELAMTAETNTITLVHQNVQPNLSLLTYFGYDVGNPDTDHPLYTNLKEISLLQLLQPEDDYAYKEPPLATDDQLKSMKSRQKATYYKKRRRWQRTKAVVEETQAGGFAGLVVASSMDPASILQNLIPLLRGGAQVVVYSPCIEPLSELMDCYSKSRRAAFNLAENPVCPSEEYPVDPRLLIGASLYTTRARPYQVLPGRTHPKMTGRGGSEGYIFVGTRVYPAQGKVEARGAFKRRKVDVGGSDVSTPQA